MAITREKKTEILTQLKDIVASATAIAFVHFKGLSVAEASELRVALKKEGVRYLVTKKTLLKRTLDEAKVEGEAPALDGEVAFAYLPKEQGDDLTAPART
ncbi:MAG: 50S ribosomal protein L10, partial [Candidatus Paceibacteria bacterium]